MPLSGEASRAEASFRGSCPSCADKLELKEAYKMGAKDSYIYMQSMEVIMQMAIMLYRAELQNHLKMVIVI